MLGAFKARVAPFNVNYRYVAEELRYLLDRLAAPRRSSTTSRSRRRSPSVLPDAARSSSVLLQVRRRVRQRPAARRRSVRGRARGGVARARRRSSWSPDDLYILYTGGTTGMPKGVLWRQARHLRRRHGRPAARHAPTFERSRRSSTAPTTGGAARAARRRRSCTAPASGCAFTHVSPAATRSSSRRRPSASTRPTSGDSSSASRSTFLLIVGDAFARPLLDELDAQRLRPVVARSCCCPAARR